MALSIQLIEIPESLAVSKREFFLTANRLIIGRGFDADLELVDEANTMSRAHALIECTQSGQYVITDTSVNGLFVNGARVQPQVPVVILDGDQAAFCGYTLLFGISGQFADVSQKINHEAPKPFDVESNISANGPIITNLEVEDIPMQEDLDMVSTYQDDTEDLMFDPFADTSGMTENINHSRKFKAAKIAPLDNVETGNLMVQKPDLEESVRRNLNYAMSQAIDRFLCELEPQELQREYDSYMSAWSSRKKRYWEIYKKQFAKKQTSGEYRRLFLALVSEEVQKR